MRNTAKRRSHLSQYPDMMTIKDICEFLSVSDTTAYRFVNEEPIVCVRVGREYKISRKSLAEYLNCDLEVS